MCKLSDERVNEIENKAEKVVSESDKYQLLHAIFAIEELYRNSLNENCKKKYDEMKERNKDASDEESEELIFEYNKAKKEKQKGIRISLSFIDEMEYNCSRTIKTLNNVFMISLPKSMENVRTPDGNIDAERLKNLRKLLAHELGHIVLHSKALGVVPAKMDEFMEKEADLFAETLLELRKKQNKELNNVI